MESILVSDCMSEQFESFRPDMFVADAASHLVKNELLGGPVLDSDGCLIGWISEQDCLSAVTQSIYYSERVATVSDIMRTEVLTVEPSMSVVDLAKDMLGDKPKVYPVVVNGCKVIGVISRRRILRELSERIVHPEHA